MVSKAQMRAVSKYKRKAYDEVSVRFKKGDRDKVKDFAYRHGYDSLNQFILDAINYKMLTESWGE